MIKVREIFRRIYSSPEEEIYKKVVLHAELCASTASKIKEALEGLRSSEGILECLNEVHRLERRADDIRRDILEELSRGGLPPLTREDFIRLVERIDMIADWSKAAARLLRVIEKLEIPGDLLEILINVSAIEERTAFILLSTIRKMAREYRPLLNDIKRIEELEDEADSLYIEGLRVLIRGEPPHIVILERLVDALENAVDACEDASDVLEEIIVRMIR